MHSLGAITSSAKHPLQAANLSSLSPTHGTIVARSMAHQRVRLNMPAYTQDEHTQYTHIHRRVRTHARMRTRPSSVQSLTHTYTDMCKHTHSKHKHRHVRTHANMQTRTPSVQSLAHALHALTLVVRRVMLCGLTAAAAVRVLVAAAAITHGGAEGRESQGRRRRRWRQRRPIHK